MFELAATTEPGARLVRLAETLAADFATRAAVHDRDASYPHASVDALRDSGYLAAAVPAEHGGMGVASVHDLIVAASRLARGDASVAIGANMHMAVLRNVLRRWEMAVAAGKDRRAAAFAATLEDIARGGTVIATAISEHGLQDLTRPATTARRTLDGWRIDGRKAFCTMAPAATVLFTAVSFVDDDGCERYGYARVPAGTPGVVVHDDWDALGMRASGSHSVSFESVELPEAALRGGFPVGSASDYMESNLSAGLFHASASLGIAETAQQEALRAKTVDGRGRMLVAENAIELSAARAGARPRGDADRRPLRRQPDRDRDRAGADRGVRGGPGDEGVRQRGVRAGRRPRPRAVRRRRLPQRPPARARLPRRPRGGVHAPARGQPGVRLRRQRRTRRRARAPLRGSDPLTLAKLVRAP